MSQKKCPSCKNSVTENTKFCPDCGAPVTGAAKKQVRAQKSNSLRDTLIIVGVLAVVAVVFIVMQEPKEVPKPTPTQTDMAHPEMGEEGMGALANLPTDYNSLVQMGNQTMDQRNYPMAAECYKRALAIKGDSPDVRTDYGACLHGMGLPQRALEEFYTVIGAYPKHTIANFNLGVVYYSIQQTDSAKVYFNKYLQIDPNGSAAPSAKKYLEEIG